jgi:sugar transferase (PEP-CTERM/EpsH1 system associated)
MKILFLTSRIPYPLDKGDKLRAYHFIKELSHNNNIILCAINDSKTQAGTIEHLSQYCEKIYVYNLTKFQILISLLKNILNKLPFQVAYFTNNNFKRKINEVVKNEKPDIIFYQLIRMSEYARDNSIPKVIDYMDVLSIGIEKRIEKEVWLKKYLLTLEYARLKNYEFEVFKLYKKHFIITEQDRDLIPHPNRNEIEIISNGVDLSYYKPSSSANKKEFEVVFSGNMAYPPNIEGALFLVEKIMPLVWAIYPDSRVVIVGTSPTKKIQSLASKNVIITGKVDDIREYFYLSKIFVGPLFMNTGLQNKLLEAMACFTPCITTTEANNALKADANIELLIANSETEFAKKIIELLENENLREFLADKAYKFIISNHKWSVIAGNLSQILLKLKNE